MTAARGAADPTTLQFLTAVEEDDRSAHLRARAEHLRASSVGMHDFVAQAYRRRASELEFEAWLTQLRSGQAGAAA